MNNNLSNSNIELIRKYQATLDQDILNQLAVANAGLINGYAIKCLQKVRSTYWLDKDELVAIFNLEFVKAVQTFDCDKGFKFSTYVVSCMKYKFMRLGYARYGVPNCVSVGDLLAYQSKFKDSKELRYVACRHKIAIHLDELKARMVEVLEPQQRVVLSSLYLEEKSVKEVANDLKVSRQRVCQIKQSALAKLLTTLERKDFV